jgi:hypothetical protein
MYSKNIYIAGALIVVTLLAWTGVVFFVRGISDAEAARVIQIQNTQQSSTQQSALVRMHAIAEDTVEDRARLDQLLSVDVVSTATVLRNVGKTTHVDVKLSGALPELPPGKTPSGPQIQAVGFSVQADGTFAALMRTVQLIETLPLASSIVSLDIQRAQDSAGVGTGTWHMSVYIRVFTTSNISS